MKLELLVVLAVFNFAISYAGDFVENRVGGNDGGYFFDKLGGESDDGFPLQANCYMKDSTGVAYSKVTGNFTLRQEEEGGPVTITGEIAGFEKQTTDHFVGFHIHEFGDLSNECDDVGDHFNPDGNRHGAPTDPERHHGDLGNIRIFSNGTAELHIIDSWVQLHGSNSVVGRALVIHGGEDDEGQYRETDEDSATTGNAGDRMACCTIANANSSDKK